MAAASSTGDAQALAQAVGLHAVGEAVGDHLGELALGVRDLVGADAVDGGGHRPVHVGAARQRVDETGVLGEVRDAAQLHLVVVGHQEGAALGRHEGTSELLAQLGAHRDVVQVGAVRRDAPGAGHGLAEGRVDAPVGLHLGQQALAVGRAQLLDLAVLEQRLDDGVGPAQALERLGIGGEAGLRLLARREPELLVEHRAQLRRRVHVELVAGAAPAPPPGAWPPMP